MDRWRSFSVILPSAFLMFLFATESARADDLVDRAFLKSALRTNVESLRTFQGTASVTRFSLVQLGPDNGPETPRPSPFQCDQAEISFIFDRSRHFDFRIDYNYSWQATTGEAGAIHCLQKRFRDKVQTLTFENNNLRAAVLSGPNTGAVDADFPNPLLQLYAAAMLPDSRCPDGYWYFPLFTALDNEENYDIEQHGPEISGYPTVLLISAHELPDRSQLIAFSWLAPRLNYLVVKQSLHLLPPPQHAGRIKFREDFVHENHREPKLKDWADRLEQEMPARVVVGLHYEQIAPNLRVPTQVEEFCFLRIPPTNKTDFSSLFDTYKEIARYKGKGFTPAAVNRTTLKADRLHINDPISPNVFEENIFPPGTKISYIEGNITPSLMDAALDNSVVTIAPEPGEVPTPSKSGVLAVVPQQVVPTPADQRNRFLVGGIALLLVGCAGMLLLVLKRRRKPA